MISLKIKHGLPFANINVIYNGKNIEISNVLIDTGSMSSIIPSDTALTLNLKPNPNDVIHSICGVGGTEFVYEKQVDKIILGDTEVLEMKIHIGAMDYGFGINGIIGMDFLMASGAIIDLSNI